MGRVKKANPDKYSAESNVKRGNRYTTEQKLQCLMILQANKFSLNKTAKEVGVTDMTLKSWLDRYGSELFGNAIEAKIEGETNEMISLLPEVQKQIDQNQVEFLRMAHEVKLKALKLLQQKLNRTKNISTLAFIVKTLDVATNNATKGSGAPPPDNSVNKQVNMFTQIHNKYSLTPPDEDE